MLGAIVTALGLVAVVQEATGTGSIRATITAMLVIVVLWALAIPLVMKLAKRASEEVLAPLGLVQSGAVLEGERHGRDVHVRFTGSAWVTRVDGDAEAPSLEGDEVAAYAGRGDFRHVAGCLRRLQRGEGGGAQEWARRQHLAVGPMACRTAAHLAAGVD